MKAKSSYQIFFILFFMVSVLMGFSPLKVEAQEKNSKQQAAVVELEKEVKTSIKKTPFTVFFNSKLVYQEEEKKTSRELEIDLRFTENIFNCQKAVCKVTHVKVKPENLPFTLTNTKTKYEVTQIFTGKSVVYSISFQGPSHEVQDALVELNWKNDWLPYEGAENINLDLDNYQKRTKTLSSELKNTNCNVAANECTIKIYNINASINKVNNTYQNVINLYSFYPQKFSQSSANGYLELIIEFNHAVELKNLQKELLYFNAIKKTYLKIKPENLTLVKSGTGAGEKVLYEKVLATFLP